MTLLSDGYGDQATVDEAIADFDAWLHRRAHQLIPSTDHRHDDLVQEGRIAMWHAYQQYDPAQGALPAWLTKHANWHMHDVLARRGKWTGSPSRREGRHEFQEPPTRSLDALLAPEEGQVGNEAAGGVVDDIADAAMDAYHRGEIAQALAELTEAQRRYVEMRFWGEATGPELKAVFGYDPKGLWRTAKGGAARRLERSLAHLNLHAA